MKQHIIITLSGVFLLIMLLTGCEQYEIVEPNVTLAAEPTSVAVDDDVTFIVNGLATHYVIYFGDGGKRSFANPDAPIVYSYSESGSYEAYVYAMMADRWNEKSSNSNTITITVSE